MRLRSNDGLTARLRLERDLQSAGLHADGLPPAALLCVRYLRAPAPAPHWGETLRARLNTAAARAVRARPGTLLPATADALLFDDRSALLAALAADWLAGRAGSVWWWGCLVGGANLAALLALWRQEPEAAPAALVRLDAAAQAEAWAAQIPAQEARALLEQVAAAFGLRALHAALRAAPEPAPQPPSPMAPPAALSGPGAPHPPAPPALLPEARRPSLPLIASGQAALPSAAHAAPISDLTVPPIPPVSAALLALARTLLSDPVAARSPEFARVVAAMARGAPATAATMPAPAHAPAQAPPFPARVSPQPPDLLNPDATTPEPLRAPDVPVPVPSHAPADARFQPPPAAPAVSPPVPPAATRTRYGGVFFLINLAVARGLYADFDAPLAPSLALDLYDFLALAGLHLWNAPFVGDPLWPLLGELAGRSADEAPGAGFAPPHGELLEPWFAALWAGMADDLVMGLGVEGAAVLPPLFARPARIHHTPMRLDILFALDDLEIAFRRTGLDRDPGWLPAARRNIRFHFVD